ncbi:hypothetical protein B0T25DRAFT_173146 [Lasiosphaeria hispida]|uniref:Uncharacterized protein n=1 Tax=Lasiosphaeria hispida TaxID=260671 RepID=A0AAJ0HNJ4_9PEZI|nr:hypothetical protein B0T25DRAFT_173146 [Lasiosphaeria hispida]
MPSYHHTLRGPFLATFAQELIPRIRAEEIEDKSKADGFAKFLVCAQIVWFYLHAITRVTQRLSLSLLELNTLAHAACTLFAYTRWWDKPRDVLHPSLIPAAPHALEMRCLLDFASSYYISPDDGGDLNRGRFHYQALGERRIASRM